MIKQANKNCDRDNVHGICPDEKTLGLFVEQALEAEQMESVAGHLLDCPQCRERARDHAEWIAAGRKLDVNEAPTEVWQAVRAVHLSARLKDARMRWRRIAATFMPKREYLAAADGQTADQVQQDMAVRSGFIYFAANVPPGHKDAWHARLAIPTAVTDETVLRLQVFDGADRPVENGTLTFCGVDLGIEEGYAYMSIKSFRKNIGISLIALKTEDGRVVPGEPVRAREYESGI